MEDTRLARECLQALEGLVHDARHTYGASKEEVELALHSTMDALVQDEIHDIADSLYGRGPLGRPHVAWLVMSHTWKCLGDDVDADFERMARPASNEGPVCANADEDLDEIKDMGTTHPYGLVGVFAFWILTGDIWVDENAELASAPPVTTLTAYDERRGTQVVIQGDRDIADFMWAWHALSLAYREGTPPPPEQDRRPRAPAPGRELRRQQQPQGGRR
ncbi:hypothetical protein F4820DRAFT_448960 [Hypoxylon rubiginosum]|uniref:Uncharacterized protein n=1 Tax=Hypoxylon rubiginosum TaxID=110542 RepID=A0ACB9YZY2_9PEZI|nr:hypothetical protein F4820DRAFT_448960 [Hypoxylon rubiginosum]